MRRYLFLFIAILLLLCARQAHSLPSFPGAEGWGTDTIGGRGGTVLFVTNLNDSGTGSLRAAATATGRRIVVFRVGGTIILSSTLRINNPYITIAGQTAPGGGIQVRGAQLQITTHDVIIRGMRIRSAAAHAIELNSDMGGGDVFNCVFDHNSFAYGMDENVTSWTNNQTTWDQSTYNVTFSWNIVGPPLWNCSGCEANHASGYLNNPWVGTHSFHHNYFTNNQIRNPIVEGPSTTEWINNLFYNWAHEPARLYWGTIMIKNHWIAGPNTTTSYSIRTDTGMAPPSQLQPASIYLSHNIGPGRLTDTGDDWLLVSGGTSQYRANTLPYPLWGVAQDDVTTVKSKVLDNVGAIVPSRDSLDQEMVDDANNGTGSYISTPYWPTLASGSPPTDTDGDGVPDSYEAIIGSNPAVYDSGNDEDADGYLNIEEYINSFYAEPTEDTYPDAFSFVDVTGASLSTVYTSNIITVSGIDNTAQVSVVGGTYSKNGGAFTSENGTAELGDEFAVRQTSSGSYGTTTDVILNIGGRSDTYSVTTMGDTTPPVLSAGSPSGVQPAGTTQVTMSVTTNENSTCRYGASDLPYASLTTMASTGGTYHTQEVTNLIDGAAYTRYIRCQDIYGNANTTGYVISWSVASAPISVALPASAAGVSFEGATIQ